MKLRHRPDCSPDTYQASYPAHYNTAGLIPHTLHKKLITLKQNLKLFCNTFPHHYGILFLSNSNDKGGFL